MLSVWTALILWLLLTPISVKRPLLRSAAAPVLLDVLTYRFSGHSPSDASSYRTKEELAAWQEVDPLITYRAELVKAGIADDSAFEAILENVKKEMTEVVKLAVDPQVSPYMDLVAQPMLLRILCSLTDM